MGLWLLVFRHEEWKRIYSDNCSLRTTEEWNSEGSPSINIPIGIVYIVIGVIYQLMYIPFILAMLKPEFIRHSCYKIMFLLSVIDMIALPCDSFISGIQGLLGQHYCTNPILWYLVGCVGYLGATMACILLAIDRFFEITFPKLATRLFGGNMVYLWMMIPLAYMGFTMTQIPAFYSIKSQAFYYDPYYATPGFEGNPYFKQLTFLVSNSVLTIIFIGGVYSFLTIQMIFKTTVFKNAHLSKLQRVMLFQSMAICVELFVVAVVYVGNQFYPVPELVVKIEHLTWISVHGDTPIVYLLLNKSLRKSFFKMVHRYIRGSKSTSKVFAVRSGNNNSPLAAK